MAKEGTVKRRAGAEKPFLKEGFEEETPLVSSALSGFGRIGKTINIMLTDRGMYENAKKQLAGAYNRGVSRIRSIFRRK